MHTFGFRLDWRAWLSVLRGKSFEIAITFIEMPSLHEMVRITLAPPWGRAMATKKKTGKDLVEKRRRFVEGEVSAVSGKLKDLARDIGTVRTVIARKRPLSQDEGQQIQTLDGWCRRLYDLAELLDDES